MPFGPNAVALVPPMAVPPYNPVDPSQGAVQESTYGGRITRISDPQTFDNLSRLANGGTAISTFAYRHMYALMQPWNADGSVLALDCPDPHVNATTWIVDGRTYRALRCLIHYSDGQSFRWSNVDPDKAYVTHHGAATIASIRPLSDTSTSPIYHDIATFSQFDGSAFVGFASDKGNVSLDDRYFAVVGQRASDNCLGIAVWDQTASGQIGSTYWYKSSTAGSTTDEMAGVSPLGTAIIVQNNQGSTGTAVGVDSAHIVNGGTGYTDGAAVTFSGGGNLSGSANRRQSKSGVSSSNNPTLAFDLPVLPGSTILAFVYHATGSTPSCGLSGSASYSTVVDRENSNFDPTGGGGEMLYAICSLGGTCTANFTTAAASSYIIEEWTGLTTPQSHDAAASNVGASANPSVGPTATLAQANELVVSFAGWTSALTPSAGSGYTADTGATQTSGPSCMAQSKVVNSTAAVSASFTASASKWVAIVKTLTISASTHATGTISAPSGTITGMTLSSRGGGYTSVPTMTIPGGSGATFCLGMQGTWWFSLDGFPGPTYQDATGAALATGKTAFLCAGDSHSDLALDAQGNEVFVMLGPSQSGGNTTNLGIPGLPVSVLMVPFGAGGLGTAQMVASYDNDVNCGGHISGQAIKRPGWVYLSDQTCSGNVAGNGRPAWGRQSIVALELATGRMTPIAGLHASYDTDNTATRADNSAAGTNFLPYQSDAVPNRDGTKVLFASDWGQYGLNSLGSAPCYAFVVDLPS